MPRYNVYGRVVGSKFMGSFEAATAEEAEEMAWEANGSVCLCHQCAKEIDDPEIDNVEVEEAE